MLTKDISWEIELIMKIAWRRFVWTLDIVRQIVLMMPLGTAILNLCQETGLRLAAESDWIRAWIRGARESKASRVCLPKRCSLKTASGKAVQQRGVSLQVTSLICKFLRLQCVCLVPMNEAKWLLSLFRDTPGR